MKEVIVVQYASIYDYSSNNQGSILGVYDTLEKAEKAVKDHMQYSSTSYVYSYELQAVK